ncbi:hypothetical protein HK405_014041, partial [Cladochytrium tenue]
MFPSTTPSAKRPSYARVSRLVSTVAHCIDSRQPVWESLDVAPSSATSPPSPPPLGSPSSSPPQPLTSSSPSTLPLHRLLTLPRPSAALYAFAHRLLSSARLSLPVILVALRYLDAYYHEDQLREEKEDETGLHQQQQQPEEQQEQDHLQRRRRLTPFTALLACLVAANKFLDDSRYSNAWWSRVAELPLEQVNAFERDLLRTLRFRLAVPAEDYRDWAARMQAFARAIEDAERSHGESYLSVSPVLSPLLPAVAGPAAHDQAALTRNASLSLAMQGFGGAASPRARGVSPLVPATSAAAATAATSGLPL